MLETELINTEQAYSQVYHHLKANLIYPPFVHVLYVTHYATIEQLLSLGCYPRSTLYRHINRAIKDGLIEKTNLSIRLANGGGGGVKGGAVDRKKVVYQLTRSCRMTLTAFYNELGIDLKDEYLCRKNYIDAGGGGENPISAYKSHAWHTLGTVSMFTGLLGCSGIKSIRYLQERFHHAPASVTPFSPDATCVITGDNEMCHYLYEEFDTGTEDINRLQEKLDKYTMLLDSDILLTYLPSSAISYIVDDTREYFEGKCTSYSTLRYYEKKLSFPVDYGLLPEKVRHISERFYKNLDIITKPQYERLKQLAQADDEERMLSLASDFYARRRRKLFLEYNTSLTMNGMFLKGLSLTCMSVHNIPGYFSVLYPSYSMPKGYLSYATAFLEDSEGIVSPHMHIGDIVFRNVVHADGFYVILENISDDLGGRYRCKNALEGGVDDIVLLMLVESEEDIQTFLSSVRLSPDMRNTDDYIVYGFILYETYLDMLMNAGHEPDVIIP